MWGVFVRRIPIEYAKEGDALGRTLYNSAGGMLLKEDSVLDANTIKRLKNHGYLSIYVKDKYTDDNIEEIFKPKIMNRIYGINNNLSKMIVNYANNRTVDNKKMRNQVNGFIDIINQIMPGIMSSKSVLENLATISVYDDYTLTHSLNMMMLSSVLARDMGYNMLDIRMLAVGCVLHDIGKLFVPIEIIRKAEKLTDEEYGIIRTHAIKGYDFLKRYTELPFATRNISLCHHERIDGLGYPNGLKGDQIHNFSKIASISDVFDALVSDRPYRRAIPIHEAREYILGADGQFDLNAIMAFANSINPFPKDAFVRLSDGREGSVYEINQNLHTRPKIKILGERGKKVKPYIMDLTDNNNIVIEEVLHVFSFDK